MYTCREQSCLTSRYSPVTFTGILQQLPGASMQGEGNARAETATHTSPVKGTMLSGSACRIFQAWLSAQYANTVAGRGHRTGGGDDAHESADGCGNPGCAEEGAHTAAQPEGDRVLREARVGGDYRSVCAIRPDVCCVCWCCSLGAVPISFVIFYFPSLAFSSKRPGCKTARKESTCYRCHQLRASDLRHCRKVDVLGHVTQALFRRCCRYAMGQDPPPAVAGQKKDRLKSFGSDFIEKEMVRRRTRDLHTVRTQLASRAPSQCLQHHQVPRTGVRVAPAREAGAITTINGIHCVVQDDYMNGMPDRHCSSAEHEERRGPLPPQQI